MHQSPEKRCKDLILFDIINGGLIDNIVIIDLKLLQSWLTAPQFDNAEKIAAITSIYDRLGIEKLTKKAMNTFFETGVEELNRINVEEEKKSNLRNLINYLINREN